MTVPLSTAGVLMLVNTGLYSALAGILAVLGVWNLCAIRRGNDPARIFILWSKLSLFCFASAALCAAISSGLNYAKNEVTSPTHDDYLPLNDSIEILSDIGMLLSSVGAVLLAIALLELGNGLMKAAGSPAGQIVRRGTLIMGFILLMIAAVRFVDRESLRSSMYNYLSGGDKKPLRSQMKNAKQLQVVFDLGLLLSTLGVAPLGLCAVRKAQQKQSLSKIGRLYLSAIMLSLMRNVWNVIYDYKWLLGTAEPERYLYVLDPICDAWTASFVLFLLIIIGRRNWPGVWSAGHPKTAEYRSIANGEET